MERSQKKMVMNVYKWYEKRIFKDFKRLNRLSGLCKEKKDWQAYTDLYSIRQRLVKLDRKLQYEEVKVYEE